MVSVFAMGWIAHFAGHQVSHATLRTSKLVFTPAFEGERDIGMQNTQHIDFGQPGIMTALL